MEVSVATLVIGLFFAVFLGGMYTISRATVVADERVTAESLARAQMEYVRSQPYSEAPWDYTVTSSERSAIDPPEKWYDPDSNPPLLDASYAGWVVTVSASCVIGPGIDNELQKITVSVYFPPDAWLDDDVPVVTLESYRSMR